MYGNKLALAVKVKGKVLREHGDTTYLPFGSEYSLLIKNLNSVRASVKVEIDGTEVTQGVSLVVNPNDSIELERFIRDGNLSQGNRFKFIKRTSKIASHRGATPSDGLIRVEFQFESPRKQLQITRRINNDSNLNHCTYLNSHWNHPPLWSSTITSQVPMASGQALTNCSYQDVGITAPGSVSNQEFQEVDTFNLDPTVHVLVMQLFGEQSGKSVTQTVTTRTKVFCSTCGTQHKSYAKFCSNCGTALHLI